MLDQLTQADIDRALADLDAPDTLALLARAYAAPRGQIQKRGHHAEQGQSIAEIVQGGSLHRALAELVLARAIHDVVIVEDERLLDQTQWLALLVQDSFGDEGMKMAGPLHLEPGQSPFDRFAVIAAAIRQFGNEWERQTDA